MTKTAPADTGKVPPMIDSALADTETPDPEQARLQRQARRITDLEVNDPQFAAAQRIPAVFDAAREPGGRLAPVLEALVQGYADRPALGKRRQEHLTDPATGATSTRLLPEFDTTTYRELWTRVTAVATAWSRNPTNPVNPGDFVVTVGFSSPDYLTVDLVCAYLGLVSVPLQHNASVAQLSPIIAEVEPRVLAVAAAYLDLAVEAALGSPALRRVVVFDYEPASDEHRENLARAQQRLHDAAMTTTIDTLAADADHGAALPPVPLYTADDDQRLAVIFYTSGSTGTPKGAMYTEAMVKMMWTQSFADSARTPVINVNFMPLNHLGGRLALGSSFVAGGTSYFVAKPDLSTLFEDFTLVRPTDMALVPRVVDLLFQHYRGGVDRRLDAGMEVGVAEEQAATELRERILGGRLMGGFVATAPLSPEMKDFLRTRLDVHLVDGYGMTEVGGISADGAILRPPVIDYKLIDVPELGYFGTDKPHPRGELLVRSETATPGYYKRPEITAEVFDADGYYHTGDVVAEIEPDLLTYLDRRNNVMKLSQGEFVAVSRLETIFSGAPLIQQIFVYGNSERANLLAVVVPTAEAQRTYSGDPAALKSALRKTLQRSATAAQLQSYEVPVDVLVETVPFSPANGLLTGVGKLLRPKLKAHYGQRLEQLYTDLADARVDELRALRDTAADQPVIDTVIQAASALLDSADDDVAPDSHFIDLGGDSLSALTFSNLLADVFDVEVPVGVIIGPAADLSTLARYIETEKSSGGTRPTFATVHGADATEVKAAALTLDKFLDGPTRDTAKTLPHTSTGDPHTVLLTGANGYLGRFLALEWLRRLHTTGGTLIVIVRGEDSDAAQARLEAVFDSGDPHLLDEYRALAAEHLDVIAGDIGEPRLGLDEPTWQSLADRVDLIVHPAALVNHVLPYRQLFGPNVVGTAEIIRLAITTRIKPVTYLSTVSVSMTIDPNVFEEDGDIRVISAVRAVDGGYASGYGNSKWAGEVLLREAHDLCGLPVAVFRSDEILAHSTLKGQINVPDAFTRLMLSLLRTGIAPLSFYQTDAEGHRQRAHYPGLPADFVAESITTLGREATSGFRSFDVMNPHDDGISLDVFVDWLIAAGQPLVRIDSYDDWFARFETALKSLPDGQRQQTALPLLDVYRVPQPPLLGASSPAAGYQAAVRAADIGPDHDIPHLTSSLIDKYVSDLQELGLLR
ncbi:thioester reductase domain-containing protein [soil metagenome]